jgi:hypothetical protein
MKSIRAIVLVAVITLGFAGSVKANASCCGSPECCASSCSGCGR